MIDYSIREYTTTLSEIETTTSVALGRPEVYVHTILSLRRHKGSVSHRHVSAEAQVFGRLFHCSSRLPYRVLLQLGPGVRVPIVESKIRGTHSRSIVSQAVICNP